jgi:hypothetical protein
LIFTSNFDVPTCHKEALMEVMVLCKLRLAALEVLLTGAVVPDLHFIGSPSPRVFTKNSFPQFSPIHKFGENLAADAESRGTVGRRLIRLKRIYNF